MKDDARIAAATIAVEILIVRPAYGDGDLTRKLQTSEQR
jgi:hypothetical protein